VPFINTPILGGHAREEWQRLFLVCAGFTVLNLLLLLLYRDVPSGANKTDSLVTVFVKTIRNIFEPRLSPGC